MRDAATRSPAHVGGRRHRWRAVACGALAATAAFAAAVPALLRWEPARRYLSVRVEAPHDWPDRTGVGAIGLRQGLLRTRDHALARGDLETAALLHADLAQEALLRTSAVHQAWMARRHPGTKLFPRGPRSPLWNYRDTGADFFGFLLHSGARLQPATLPLLHETLRAEDELEPDGSLCQPVHFATGKPVRADDEERMFASSEYVKDGLISVYERFGAATVGPRMYEVLDAVIAHSRHPARSGLLAGRGSEVNGNVLQACSRLSFSADTPQRREAYASMAARTADAVTGQMLPACNGLPVRTFNYERNRAVETHIKLRDHGNEIMPGLAEAYAMAVARRAEDPEWARRADRWAEPIEKMFATVFQKGCDANGLLLSGIDTATLEITDARPCDNWGYVLSGVLLFTSAARQHGVVPPERLDALEAAADRAASAVAALYGASWEGEGMDGYCDTLESALYVARHRPSRAGVLLPWVDDQIGLLFSRQGTDGFVGGNYLDGNFIRTALMYADEKSGGWHVKPFRDDVRVGYARDGAGNAVLTVAADRPYRGTLVRDTARHREIMRLPFDWPRLNSWPEWCEADGQAVAEARGVPAAPDAEQLGRGLPLDLPEHGLVVLRLRNDRVRTAGQTATTNESEQSTPAPR